MNEQLRTYALSAVRAALPVFRDLDSLYTAGVTTEQQLTQLRAKRIARMDERSMALSAVLGGLTFFAFLALTMTVSKKARINSSTSTAAVILVIVGIAAGLLVRYLVRRQCQMRAQQESPEEQALNTRLENISRNIQSVVHENQALIETMPRDYQYYYAVSFFEQALANGRADSMKEAINLFEEHQHRMTLEQNSAIALHEQFRQSQMISAAQQSARNASINSGIAAGFSILSFLSSD